MIASTTRRSLLAAAVLLGAATGATQVLAQAKAPVRIGDTVVARCTATAVDKEKGRATFATVAMVGDTVVLEGEAMLLVPKRPVG